MLSWFRGLFNKKKYEDLKTIDFDAEYKIESPPAAPEEDAKTFNNRLHLQELQDFVFEFYPRVQNPNYLVTGKYSPQWKQGFHGDMYYQLPNKHILAVIKDGWVHFDRNGIQL
jgi:hypothetical protein